MGSATFARTRYDDLYTTHYAGRGPVTRTAETQAMRTGTLNPLVDPAGHGVIRRSLPRFDDLESGMHRLTIGMPMSVETRVDTTGSMGGNVDVAMRVLPDAYELASSLLPGFDLQMAIGIFGDVQDRFALCRAQFEMETDKLVESLSLMVPLRDGGDAPEDPHYGLFGAAYLTDARINQYGLRRYDFTVSDAPAHNRFQIDQLLRIYGDEVFNKVVENGYQLNRDDLPSIADVVRVLLEKAHAFYLQVGHSTRTEAFWAEIFGDERVVLLPSTELLPHVQAVIIGLTEGTLALDTTLDFLVENGVGDRDADAITRSVANIPIGAQVPLREGLELPVAGDIFREKTDLWPIDPRELDDDALVGAEPTSDGPNWL